MKRSDISTLKVLDAYARSQMGDRPDAILERETGAHPKVVWAAMERELDRGYLDFGVNLRGGWLTDEGLARLEELRADQHREES